MGNIYTTSTNVLDELPGSVPETLDEDKVAVYIADASRYVDARLSNYEAFADIAGTPPTPAVIEKIARLVAAHDCLVYMGELRGDEKSGAELRQIADKMLDDLNPADGSKPRAMIDPSEYDYSQTPKNEAARAASKSSAGAIYRADIVRDDAAE